MSITRENYELFFIDYLDGNLSVEQTAELELFFINNPDLKQEFQDYKESMQLAPEQVSLPVKNILKKQFPDLSEIRDINYQDFFIARHEGDLSSEKIAELEDFLKTHSDKEEEYILYSKVYLKPESNIRFEKRSQIKHYRLTSHKRLYYWISSAAASLVLIFALYFAQQKMQQGTPHENIVVVEQIDDANIVHKENNQQLDQTLVEKQNTRQYKIFNSAENRNNNETSDDIITYEKSKHQQIEANSMQREKINLQKINTISTGHINAEPNMKEELLVVHNEATELLETNTTGEDYSTIKEIALEKVKKTPIVGAINEQGIDKNTLLPLLAKGAKGINNIARKNFQFEREYDESGDVLALIVKAGPIVYSKKKVKE